VGGGGKRKHSFVLLYASLEIEIDIYSFLSHTTLTHGGLINFIESDCANAALFGTLVRICANYRSARTT